MGFDMSASLPTWPSRVTDEPSGALSVAGRSTGIGPRWAGRGLQLGPQWLADAPAGTEIHSARAIGKDRVLIMRTGNPAEAMIIKTANGVVENEMPIPTTVHGTHGQFRHIRMTKSGTLTFRKAKWSSTTRVRLCVVGSGQIGLAGDPS